MKQRLYSFCDIIFKSKGHQFFFEARQAQGGFNSAPDDTMMVGNAISDIRQGKLAKVKTVAVTWGFQSRELLIAENPDHLADTPTDLLTLFN
jgi:phosphoglycolate phosphatase